MYRWHARRSSALALFTIILVLAVGARPVAARESARAPQGPQAALASEGDQGPAEPQGVFAPDGEPQLAPDGTVDGAVPRFLGLGEISSTLQVVKVFSGTMSARVALSNPGGITGVNEFQSANFSQRILSQAPDRVELEITVRRELHTQAPFPVDRSALPPEAIEWLAARPNWIQADDPDIVATARAITNQASLQAQAVDAVMSWVRGHVVYDYDGPRDASSVFRSGRAYCVGFANLSRALLRAVDIPARAQYGTVGAWDGWGAPVEGGRHVWVEVYYPDVGWVASDPQVTANFIDTAHIVGWLDQSGKPGTVVERLSGQGSLASHDPGFLYAVDTPYGSRSSIPVYAASVPAWDRHPLLVLPTTVAVQVSTSAPRSALDVSVQPQGTILAGWRMEAGAAWLRPTVTQGSTPDTVHVDVDATGMPPGTHVGTLSVLAEHVTGEPAAPRTVTVTLQMNDLGAQVVDPGVPDRPHRVCMPIILRR